MNKADALIVINLFGMLTLIAQIILGIFVLLLILKRLDKNNKTIKRIVQFLSDYGLVFSFFIALFATFGSLFLSEVAHFTPCKLCWYQRIFMYPQVLLLGIATLKNDFGIKRYVLPMSIIGAGIAIYHYLLQVSPIPLPCSDEIANCALKQINYFGYITIPLMSFTAFALIILFMVMSKKK